MNKSIRAADILVTGQRPSSCYIPDAARSLKTKEVRKMKWNLKKIMIRAWSLYRKGGLTFGEALHRAWLSAKAEPINAATVESAKAAAGITEEVRTWSGWRELGYEVMHGSKALFGCALIWGSKGDGAVYNARFFGASQVQAIA